VCKEKINFTSSGRLV